MSEIADNLDAIHKALAMPRGRPAGIEYFSAEAYRGRVSGIVRELVGGAG
jgi:hypothetical protein